MNYNKFNIFLTAVLVIILYFTIPFYNKWLFGKVMTPSNNMFDQARDVSIEYRYMHRFGDSYSAYKEIEKYLGKYKNVTLLLPSNEYLKANNITIMDVPEPAVFYYFTGINSVTAGSPNVDSATWVLTISKDKNLFTDKVASRQQLDSFITLYKKYEK